MVPWVPLATVPRPLGQQNTLKSLFSGPNRGITGMQFDKSLSCKQALLSTQAVMDTKHQCIKDPQESGTQFKEFLHNI